MGTYICDGIKDFDTDNIFDCGQCFRWAREADGSYTGIAMGKIVNIACKDGRLTIDNCTEEDFEGIWRTYLDLDTDYGRIKKKLAEADPIVGQAIKSGEGIRILRQDLWETLISFIISQNNNIPRIKGCIEKLSTQFGEKAGEYRGKEYFNLPTPKRLAELTAEDLARVRLGYRAPYLVKTARQVLAAGGMEEVKKALDKAEDPAAYLETFQGVGPKVASCVALFGGGKTESFPIDVWVKRVMHRLYNIEEKNMKEMSEYAQAHFGEHGGIAQQYLFYYMRGLEK